MHPGLRLLTIPAFVAAVAIMTLAGKNSITASPVINVDSLAVATVVNEFHDALLKGDSAKALNLLSDDAVILESGGVEPRSEYRSHHLPEDIKFAKAVASRRGLLSVRVEGASAWTVGTSTSKGTFKGKAIDSIGAESMVLTKETAGWRIRAIHWSSRKRGPST